MDNHLVRHGDAMEAELKAAGGVSMGTTIVAASFDGGVVLGADSRTSTGSYVANRVTDKLTRLTDQIYICRSGSAADTQNIAAHATWYLEAHTVELGRAPRVPAAARLLSQMTYANKDALQAGLIVAGWDGVDGGQVYAVPLGGTVVKVPFAVGGSGSAYVTGLCDKLWRPGMTRDECVAFVRRVVAHAVARDGSSGGCIRTVAITKDGADRQFVAGDAVPPTFGDLAPPARGPAPIAVD